MKEESLFRISFLGSFLRVDYGFERNCMRRRLCRVFFRKNWVCLSCWRIVVFIGLSRCWSDECVRKFPFCGEKVLGKCFCVRKELEMSLDVFG